MPKIRNIEKMTDNKYLNMYKYEVESEKGHKGNYYVASRAEKVENLKINNKEKLLDNEIKKLDTEHNALQTEFDSIKNLIGNNIEKSFNLFG